MPNGVHATRRASAPLLVVVIVLLTFVGSHFARSWFNKPIGSGLAPVARDPSFHRIVALSPSSVEIIYQIGAGDRLVGVSRFCKYPPEASKKPVVGGYLDLDFEAVLALEPDCVILLEEQWKLAEKLNQLGIHAVAVNHSSTRGILESVTTIGELCGNPDESAAITGRIRGRLEAISGLARRTGSKPRVLVSIDRDITVDHPERIIAAGNKGIHQEFIALCGGVNAYQGPVAFPSISREKLIALDPDIIIDLIIEEDWQNRGQDKLLSHWEAFPELTAVKNKRVSMIHENKFMVPGPRFIETLEVFSRIIQSAP